MGLLDGLMGNAAEIDASEVSDELTPILGENEVIARVFKEIRDMYVFTNKRLILIDKQGLTGKKVEYCSVPYKAMTMFTLETAGHFDMDAELKIWVSGQGKPIERELKKNTVVGIQQTLATFLPG
ncbi:PH domain-containing protein [Lacimicrobium sp. SS2-24]|uniref:PH domain-containing protein n=1 Tax=Lacimicrobium sp. SS2-24 TaxID=2005569 RepID=UPI000B4A8A06|nr:PH domain-containing protein [Lacimicrobium sp. SS2-24]